MFVCKTVDLGCSFQGQILMGFRVILLGVLEFGVSKLVGVTYKLAPLLLGGDLGCT